MSRVLLAWELGSNLGHLSRLLPLSLRLRNRGHEVLVAARDVSLATEVLAPYGIRFVQAPVFLGTLKCSERPMGFADLLLLSGWESTAALWGLVQAWGNVLRLFKPSVVVLDYAPTTLLAARILGLPCALVGTGFELPPLTVPLPTFPGASGAAQKTAAASEARALENVNGILDAYSAPRLTALRDLLRGECRWLTTFAELDQYGPRPAETYVGPMGGLDRATPVEWPEGFAYRVLAYLRPGMPALSEIISVLAAASDVAVICAAPGIHPDSMQAVRRPGFQFFSSPVSLPPLFPRTSLFLSYGPAASVAESLVSGVPQLMVPAHVEAQMTAVRVQSIGAGLTLRSDASKATISLTLRRMLEDLSFKARALEFADRHRGFDPAAAADRTVDEIERLAAEMDPKASSARRAR